VKTPKPIVIVAVSLLVLTLLASSRAQSKPVQPLTDVAKAHEPWTTSSAQVLDAVSFDPSADPPDLFSDGRQALGFSHNPTIMRSRSANVQFDRLSRQIGSKIRLNLFDDANFVAVHDRVESNSPGITSWIGHLDGVPDSDVILVINGDIMVGNITAPGHGYQVQYTGAAHRVYQIDQSAFPPEAEPIPVETTDLLADQPVALADNCTSIDVMVVYDDDARAAAGGTAAMQALISLAVSETNIGYSRSNVAQRINLVHTAEVTYSEAGFDWVATLNRLTDPADGYMDNVHILRDTYGADETVLLVNNYNYCGIAWLMTSVSPSFASHAFSVVSRGCATGYYTFAHEMGHNMGSHHDRATAGGDQGAYTYSYGYQAPDRSFRTVMAYDCPYGCPRVNYWSNPDVLYNGQPTGVVYTAPNSADNRLSLNNTACTVANWRTALSDADQDGMPDNWERDHFGDLSRNGAGDFDGDGLTDLQEYLNATNPTLQDTDGDSMPDGWEVTYGLNPLVDDADLDADNDGYSNYQEYVFGSNPKDENSKPRAVGPDFNLNLHTDVSVWRPSVGAWFGKDLLPPFPVFSASWGQNTDIPFTGQFDEDGITDVGVWRPGDGTWYVLLSSFNYAPAKALGVNWGKAGDVPVPADYDGDGITDFGIWRPSNGVWYILNIYGVSTGTYWGANGDVPVPGDYDGDRMWDFAVWRPSTGVWWIRSATGYNSAIYWGTNGDVPVPADFDGDAVTDLGIWRPSNGIWYIKDVFGGAIAGLSFGINGDIPLAGDYDGDAVADIAIWRPTTGQWGIRTSSSGFLSAVTANWGTFGDLPLGCTPFSSMQKYLAERGYY